MGREEIYAQIILYNDILLRFHFYYLGSIANSFEIFIRNVTQLKINIRRK